MSKFTFFWGASPFSNWHISPFSMDGVKFNCAEQAMMYYKAKTFGDEDSAKKIMETELPREQKLLGRGVKNFDTTVWDESREKIVLDILVAKFSQNEDCKEALAKTSGTRLVESSSYDKIWGIGLDESDPRAQDESQWQGLNLLGKLLDITRDICCPKH